jgi:hypothetical protein
LEKGWRVERIGQGNIGLKFNKVIRRIFLDFLLIIEHMAMEGGGAVTYLNQQLSYPPSRP